MEETFDLARLVHPCSPGTFFAEHWDARPLLCARGDRRYFAALFGLESLDALLAGYGAVGDDRAIRLIKRGAEPPVIPVHGTTPDLAELHARVGDGYTLNVNDVATHHAGLRRMAHALVPEIGIRPRPNLYLTAPGSRAFDLHFDTHDVMIIQLAGAKQWRVYQRIEECPTAEHSDGSSVARGAVSAPAIEVLLEAGDTLYVPRGFVHEAWTERECSLHVTVGLVMGTYLDVLHQAVAIAGARVPALRASIPPGARFGRARAEMTQALVTLLASEISADLPDLVATALDSLGAAELAAMHAVDVPRFAELEAPVTPIDLDERLHKPAGLFTHVTSSGGRARIHFQHGLVEGPWRIKPALSHVAAAASIRARDLPGSLRDEEKLRLVERMVREGLLVRC